MKTNNLIRELVINAGIPENMIREFTGSKSAELVSDLVGNRKNIQVSLDYEDVELCFGNTKFIEDYSIVYTKPKRFTKFFWKKLSKFLFNSTLYAKSGIFMIETGDYLNDRELNYLAEFYSDFSEHFLQEADFFVGIGVKINPSLKGKMRFHALSFYPRTATLCKNCFERVGKYLISDSETDEHANLCYKCSAQKQRKEHSKLARKK